MKQIFENLKQNWEAIASLFGLVVVAAIIVALAIKFPMVFVYALAGVGVVALIALIRITIGGPWVG